jgi:hypothetical protein
MHAESDAFIQINSISFEFFGNAAQKHVNTFEIQLFPQGEETIEYLICSPVPVKT